MLNLRCKHFLLPLFRLFSLIDDLNYSEKNKSNESSANQLSVERHLSTINGDKSTTTTSILNN